MCERCAATPTDQQRPQAHLDELQGDRRGDVDALLKLVERLGLLVLPQKLQALDTVQLAPPAMDISTTAQAENVNRPGAVHLFSMVKRPDALAPLFLGGALGRQRTAVKDKNGLDAVVPQQTDPVLAEADNSGSRRTPPRTLGRGR